MTPVQSIDRAMNIIKVLASKSNENWLSITELSKECELPVSTIHRLLKSLEEHDLIQQDSRTKEYGLGSIWLEYGLQMYDSIDITSQIKVEMEELMRQVNESIYFNKPMGLESLIIERIDSPDNPIRFFDKIGSRIPMNIGAANKTMLAHMPYRETENIVNTLIPEDDRPGFWATLHQVKTNGYAISRGERTEGTVAVAAPVINRSGDVEGAVSIGCVSFNLKDERLEFLIEKVINTGKRISKNLGYNG
ncbi:IclR family transcriptional regulator [Ureibacillus composti]